MKTNVYIKDHLSSNRMAVSSIGYIYQNNIYYALGGTTALSSGQEYQQYKYTDKEYDPMHGLNQYDFGARNYDPAIGRFTSVDPLAEKYYYLTPYSYCGGDPVNKVDPDGRNPIYSTQGYFMGTDDYGLQGRYIVMDNSNFNQGMLHTEAEKFDMSKEMHSWVTKKILRHYRTLPERPDYDGFVTIDEGIAWVKSHPNAIQDASNCNKVKQLHIWN